MTSEEKAASKDKFTQQEETSNAGALDRRSVILAYILMKGIKL